MTKQIMSGECGGMMEDVAAMLRKFAQGNGDPAQVKRYLKVLHEDIDITKEGSAKALEEYSKKGVIARGWDIAEEVRMGAMLSGMKTQIISVTSGVYMSFHNAIELGVGARMGRLISGLSAEEAQMVGKKAKIEMMELATEHTKVQEFLKTIAKGGDSPWAVGSMLDIGQLDSKTAMQYLKHLNENDGASSLLNTGLLYVGKVAGASSELLQRGDIRTKTVVGRARHVSEMFGHYLSKGYDDITALEMAREQADHLITRKADVKNHLRRALTAKKAGREVAPELQEVLDDIGVQEVDDIQATVDAIGSGQKAGTDATFTGDIEKKNVIEKTGAKIQEWVQAVPVAKLIAPFVKTPTNIASNSWERTVGTVFGGGEHLLKKAFPNAIENWDQTSLFNMRARLVDPNPAVRAKAAGEVTMSAAAWVSVATLASQVDGNGFPLITGGGPSDKKQKAAWKAAGWQERSILVDGKYVSYDRLDPVAGALLGFSADLTEAIRLAQTEEDTNVMAAAGMAVVASLAKNITSKTWTKGIREAADLAAEPTAEGVNKYLRNVAGSYVPGAVRDVARLQDGELKDIQGIMDAVKSRVPGLSNNLDSRRNFMGEKVHADRAPGLNVWNTLMPFSISETRDGVIAEELSKLPQGMSMPSTSLSGVDLKDEKYKFSDSQTAYDKMLELSSEVTIGGRTMRQELRRLFNSDSYQALDELRFEGEQNPRTGEIRKVVNRYRKKARTQLLKTNPSLASAVKTRKEARANRRSGLTFDF